MLRNVKSECFQFEWDFFVNNVTMFILIYFLLWEPSFTGTTSPEMWWSPHHWRFSRCGWRGCEMISPGLPFPPKAGLDDHLRSLPAQPVVASEVSLLRAAFRWHSRLSWQVALLQRQDYQLSKVILRSMYWHSRKVSIPQLGINWNQ